MIKVDSKSLARPEGPPEPLDHIASLYELKEALEACKSLKKRAKSGRNAHQPDITVAKNITAIDGLEHDFTTSYGTPSKLECPYATMINGDPPKETADPIAAEFHGDDSVGSGTAYAQQNPNQCPIRYLNQHSPEEVAKYFENHKHEIPRSHAVCISRYQQNDAKIRQLDAKYGNLQNMIQSLGVKHQQYLPANDKERDVERPSSQTAGVAVEKWAENVSGSSADAAPPPAQSRENGVENEEQQARAQHFEKPLPEIRLGESPSRPWGISVPFAHEMAASAVPSDKGIEPLLLSRPDGDSTSASKGHMRQNATGQCPLNHGARNGGLSGEAPQDKDNIAKDIGTTEPCLRSQMIFNGPVFFGYSPEQAIVLMRSGVFGSNKA